MTASTTPQLEPPSTGAKHPAPVVREAGGYASAVPANDWLPAVVLGALALLLAAFHGVRQEIKDVRQEIQGVRLKFKADLQAVETRLRENYRALEEKLDRVLDNLR